MALEKDNTFIEKLNENNFSIWKFKINMLLMKHDLDRQIVDDPPNPIDSQWTKKDNRARALINLSIDDSQIIHVKNLSTAKATYNALKDIHERSNLCSKLFLLRKLYGTKLDEGRNMSEHINNIFEIIDKLNSIGETIDDYHIAAILLCSLPPSYETLITALEARPEAELNSSFIRSKLMDEYNRRVENNPNQQTPTKAFQSLRYDRPQANNFMNHPKKQHNIKNNFKKENKFCVYCKRTNHDKTECWHLKNKQTNKSPRNNNKSALCYENAKQQNPNPSSEMEKCTYDANNFALLSSTPNKNVWILDSGSSCHISNCKDLFTKIYDVNKSEVIVANGQSLTSFGSGEIMFSTFNAQNEKNNITLKDVLYVPDIQANLLSVKRATQNGGTVIFSKNECNLMHEGKTYLTGHLNSNNNLYEIDFTHPGQSNYANIVNECKNSNCIGLWHRRLGHRNYDSIHKLINDDLAIGLKLDKCNHRTDCEICAKSKLTSKPYPKHAEHKTTNILDLIHSDLCGPMKTPTIGGKSYLLTFIDDHSRYTTIYLLSHKNEVTMKLKEFIASIKTKFGRIPKAIRSDNGREYVNKEIDDYLKSLGIKHQLTVPYSPSQNGVAERKNRSLIEMTRCLLNEANLPHRFWGEAVSTAAYLQNRLPTKINNKTPFEYWEKYRPNLSNLKTFGCKVYAYVDKTNRTKLDDRGQPGIFTGYDNNSKGYRVYTGGKSIIISRSVKFLEHIISHKNLEDEIELDLNRTVPDRSDTQNVALDFDIPSDNDNSHAQNSNVEVDEPRRSERSNKGVPPNRLIYLTQHEPKDWSDVQNIENPKDKLNWINATKEEFNSLKQNKTWILVDPPKGKNVIGCRWTFKAKCNSDGQIEKYKARLVAKGYSQKFGEDYDETYASVVSHTTIRALLVAASHKKLQVNHLDVKTAFLHGELSEDIYMKQPEGYISPGNEGKVCKLQKAIYGLKQAARAWQIKINHTLEKLNFIQSKADPCLYTKCDGENIMYIIVYVDDVIIAGSKDQIEQTVQNLNREFEIKDLGTINYYLGINIRKTSNGYYALNQSLKIKELINKYNLNDCKPCKTPMEPGYIKLDDNDNLLPNNKEFRSAVGALLYIATISRPDILAAVNILSRRNESPRKKDWEQVKRVIKYLKTTINFELILDPSPSPTLTCYSDADYAGDINDRKSTTGNLFLVGKAPINWISRKQSSVALSSAESEYLSAAQAAQEITWLLRLLEDLSLQQDQPIQLFMDNQSAIKMIESPKHNSKTKHISTKYHYIKELCEKQIITIKYCPSTEMTADTFTKPLPAPAFNKFRDNLQLKPL